MPGTGEDASQPVHEGKWCVCDVSADVSVPVNSMTICPVCKGRVNYLSREEFEQILEAGFNLAVTSQDRPHRSHGTPREAPIMKPDHSPSPPATEF